MKKIPLYSFIQGLTFFIELSLFTQTVLANEDKQKPHSIQQAVISTSLGIIEIELYSEQAPVSVSNFIRYIQAGPLMMDDSTG